MLNPLFYFVLVPQCNTLCKANNHVLKRWHASCLWCSTRKAQTNAKYKYFPYFGNFLPAKFDAMSCILTDGTGYIIYIDDTRRLKRIKDILLCKLFTYTETIETAKFAKKLFVICECLAT